MSGTNLDCSLESPDATAGLTAVTRDRTDGNGFAFIDLGIQPDDPTAPLLSGGMDDPPLTATGIHTTFDMAIDATGEVVGSAFDLRHVHPDRLSTLPPRVPERGAERHLQ